MENNFPFYKQTLKGTRLTRSNKTALGTPHSCFSQYNDVTCVLIALLLYFRLYRFLLSFTALQGEQRLVRR